MVIGKNINQTLMKSLKLNYQLPCHLLRVFGIREHSEMSNEVLQVQKVSVTMETNNFRKEWVVLLDKVPSYCNGPP